MSIGYIRKNIVHDLARTLSPETQEASIRALRSGTATQRSWSCPTRHVREGGSFEWRDESLRGEDEAAQEATSVDPVTQRGWEKKGRLPRA